MRYLGLVLACLLHFWIGQAEAQSPVLPGPGLPIVSVAYTGPGDVVSGALVWYGLRAYSSADRGNRLINTCNIADSTCADISSSASTGKLTNFASVGGTTCSYTITSGTYTTATGAVALVIASSPGLASGNVFGLANLTGTGTVSSLNGVFTATTGTTGTTVNYTATTGLGTVTITGGTLSVCSIKTFYDRSGDLACSSAACDVTQATIASRSFLIGSCINSLPCAVFGGAQQYLSAATSNSSFSGTISAVASRFANFTTSQGLMWVGNTAGNAIQLNYRQLANAVQMFEGTSGQFISNITDANFHTFQAVFNSTSSTLVCGGSAGTSCSTGGTANAISPGASAGTNVQAQLGAAGGTSPSSLCECYVTEEGFWPSIVFNSTQYGNMTTNEYSAWGPF